MESGSWPGMSVARKCLQNVRGLIWHWSSSLLRESHLKQLKMRRFESPFGSMLVARVRKERELLQIIPFGQLPMRPLLLVACLRKSLEGQGLLCRPGDLWRESVTEPQLNHQPMNLRMYPIKWYPEVCPSEKCYLTGCHQTRSPTSGGCYSTISNHAESKDQASNFFE
jgi:hypothetical protein